MCNGWLAENDGCFFISPVFVKETSDTTGGNVTRTDKVPMTTWILFSPSSWVVLNCWDQVFEQGHATPAEKHAEGLDHPYRERYFVALLFSIFTLLFRSSISVLLFNSVLNSAFWSSLCIFYIMPHQHGACRHHTALRESMSCQSGCSKNSKLLFLSTKITCRTSFFMCTNTRTSGEEWLLWFATTFEIWLSNVKFIAGSKLSHLLSDSPLHSNSWKAGL